MQPKKSLLCRPAWTRSSAQGVSTRAQSSSGAGDGTAASVAGDSAAVISDGRGEGGPLKEEEGNAEMEEKGGEGGGDKWKSMRKGMDKEFLVIAFPAFVQFSAEPLAALVNTSTTL